jgi:hypothetical protein
MASLIIAHLRSVSLAHVFSQRTQEDSSCTDVFSTLRTHSDGTDSAGEASIGALRRCSRLGSR